MCGIAGWLGPLDGGEQYATHLVRALHHRGPDGSGVRSWPEATLVHTRLSIIDLSPAGAQPIGNADGSIWAVVNGEIYNHKELRRQLISKGHVFKGHSDSEVIPHLYEEEGMDFAGKLRGMFAIAIYDSRKRIVILARDRFGIKPLFFSTSQNRLAFASEIPAILTLPGIDDRPNRQALCDLASLFFIPGPETFYSSIFSLQPGEVLKGEWDGNVVSIKKRLFHTWDISTDGDLTLTEATDRASGLIQEAVSRQLESDVPLGTLLSGGIDSSLVSAMASGGGNGELRTFNVRFPEAAYDETWAALAVANHIKSIHQTLDMDQKGGTWAHVTDVLLHAGQPFGDTSLFAVNAVCRAMRQHVTVALSGDGGDEGFGGYSFYWRMARIARLQTVPRVFWDMSSAVLSPLSRFGFVSPHLPIRLQDLAEADDTSIIQSMFCHLADEDHKRFCRDKDFLPIRRLFEPQWDYHFPKGHTRMDRLSLHASEVNTRMKLADDFLFKVDSASMKESLEVRVPMLDEELFSFGLSLPYRLKVQGRNCKKVLREVAQRWLPSEVANKPKKGFNIPVDVWVDEDFKTQLRDVLLSPSSQLSEYYSPEVYSPMVEAFCEGRSLPGISRLTLYRMAITLLSVHLALGRKAGSMVV